MSNNADVVVGLREVADWLEAHPELPPVRYASVTFRLEFDSMPDARGTLSAVAVALGERAEEHRGFDAITITGRFGPVTVRASARQRELLTVPVPEPEAEPIIPQPLGEVREFGLRRTQ